MIFSWKFNSQICPKAFLGTPRGPWQYVVYHFSGLDFWQVAYSGRVCVGFRISFYRFSSHQFFLFRHHQHKKVQVLWTLLHPSLGPLTSLASLNWNSNMRRYVKNKVQLITFHLILSSSTTSTRTQWAQRLRQGYRRRIQQLSQLGSFFDLYLYLLYRFADCSHLCHTDN